MGLLDLILTFIDILFAWRTALTFIIGLLACVLLISLSSIVVLNIVLCVIIMMVSFCLGIYWETKTNEKTNKL
jgi:hypothetical protein